jgi:hypothetical protein
MATNTPLQSVVLTSDTDSAIFSNIDQSYTDLVVVFTGTATVTNENINTQFNGDTATNYSATRMSGDGSASASTRWSNINQIYGLNINPTTPTTCTFYLNNYSNSSTNKTMLIKGAGTSYRVEYYIGLWRSTNAITSLRFFQNTGGSFKAGSTFDLYGIKSGAQKAFGGDTVTTDGNYWYHTFKTSGTFLLQRPTSVDYLVVAGGGGGGVAGGGAGGLRSTVTATGGGGSLESALSMAPGLYTVTVGAGGGTTGSDSVFSTVTSLGGGKGGVTLTSGSNGVAGGSGGGANTSSSGTARTGGAGTANQGFAGGNSDSGSGGAERGGGGGGAGAVGANAVAPNGGNGGAGVASSISGSSVSYAGGGGGTSNAGTDGTGGSGGGGNSETGATGGQNGTANTGGGGGGGYGVSIGNGGSGIVIVRYAV